MNSEFHIEKNSLYGGEKGKIDSSEYYRGLDLENIFARALIDNAFTFKKVSGLAFTNVRDALKNEERIELIKGEDPNQSPKKFETSVLVEAYKQHSQELRATELSRPLTQKLNDVDTLLDLIGEAKIDEPNFLLKIWKNF